MCYYKSLYQFEQTNSITCTIKPTHPVEIINLVNWGISTKSVIHFVFLVVLSNYKVKTNSKQNSCWLLISGKYDLQVQIFTRLSGDVIWRTGNKNVNVVSHNRARPQVLFPNSLQHFHCQNSTDHSVSTTFPVTK